LTLPAPAGTTNERPPARLALDVSFLYNLQLGLGSLVLALNLVLGARLLRAWRMRRSAVLAWVAPRPPYYGITLFIGVVFGGLVLLEFFVLRRAFGYWFFDLMMLIYYGYLTPLSARVRRGFYEDGIWAEGGFVRYGDIGGLTWRDGPPLTLVLGYRERPIARRLLVPPQHYAAARRLLRDRMEAHELHFTGKPLDLGVHDERDDI
jgi:hypothetical protein